MYICRDKTLKQMARIYKKDDQFVIWSNNSNSEKLAFDHQGLSGADLRAALKSYAVEVYLNGWSVSEVIQDLEESGFIPQATHSTTSPAISYAASPVEIYRDKGSVIYAFNGVSKRFLTRGMEQSESGWDGDDFSPNTSGRFTGRVTYHSVTADDAAKDYADNPGSWKPYQKVYNSAFRENQIVFI